MDALTTAVQNLWFGDFSNDLSQDISQFTTADFPLDFVNDIPVVGGYDGQFGNEANGVPLGFGGSGDFAAPLAFDQGQQWPAFGGWDDVQFGPELAPQLLGDSFHHDAEWDDAWRNPVDKHRGHFVEKRKRKPDHHHHHHHRRQHHHHNHESGRRHHHGKRPAPRADGPGYYSSAHYSKAPTPDPPQQQPFDVPPPPPPPPPISSSARGSSQRQVDPPDADEVSSESSQDSSSSESSHSTSDATPIYRQPERLAKDHRRGRPKERAATTQRPPHANRKPQNRRGVKPQSLPRKKIKRHNSIDDIYRVERARGISPPEQDPPPYQREGYYRQDRPRGRWRTPSPESSISSLGSDSSRYHGYTRYGSPRRGIDKIKRRQLLNAASRCTGDYLTRIKIQAPRRSSTPPWVDSISSAFHRMGFTIIDTKFEEREGIVTILAPPESVARKINQLNPDIQAGIRSIRAARVCRRGRRPGYKLQVF